MGAFFLRCFPLYDNDHSLVALAAYLVSVADFSLMWRAFLDYVYVQSYKLSVFLDAFDCLHVEKHNNQLAIYHKQRKIFF